MIKVDKTQVAKPTSLMDVTIQTSLNEIWNSGNPNKDLIDSSIYLANDVRSALSQLYHDKCAYCETYDPNFEIEHFRPKKLLAVIDRTPGQQHYGYYWLSYEWTNLMPGCHDCNKNGVKGFRFPTEGVKKNSPSIVETNVDLSANNYSHHYLIEEQPIFLNPEENDFNPFDFFNFDEFGFMMAKPPQGTFDFKRAYTTIDLFQLNREKIFATYRKWHILKIFGRINLLFLELSAYEISYSYFKKKYFEILEEIYVESKPNKQYSFFWNYIISNMPTYLSNHINNEVRDFLEPLTIEFIAFKNQ